MKKGQNSALNSDQELVAEDAKNVTFLPLGKQIAIFLIGFVGIYAISFIAEILLIAIYSIAQGADVIESLTTNNLFLLASEFFAYLLTMLAIIFTTNKDCSKLLITIKNKNSYLCGLAAGIGILGFELFYMSLLSAFGADVSTGGNQSIINEISSASTFIAILTFGIIGPITEELTYRVGLYSLLRRKNKWLAILVTSLIFGLIHVASYLFTADFLNELLLLPVYVGCGFFLTITYEKYGFVGSVIAHILVNITSLL